MQIISGPPFKKFNLERRIESSIFFRYEKFAARVRSVSRSFFWFVLGIRKNSVLKEMMVENTRNQWKKLLNNNERNQRDKKNTEKYEKQQKKQPQQQPQQQHTHTNWSTKT